MIERASTWRWTASLTTWLVLLAASRGIAAPVVSGLSLRGLQAGATTTLVIDGQELSPDAAVVLPVPIAGQSVKPGGTASRIEVELTLDSQVQPGIYALRLVTPAGISNPQLIGIDALPQLPITGEAPVTPIAFSGALSGNAVLKTSFAGKQGQRIVVEVESRRLGANLNPTVHLLDSRRVQLAWGKGQGALGGDARCEAVLPADGQYTVELHDLIYRGADPGFFRLKIGEFHYADLAFPLGVQRGIATNLSFVSTNLPTDTAASQVFETVGLQPASWPSGVLLLSGPRPQIQVSEHPELVETAAAEGQLQTLPAAPIAVSGRLQVPGEEDRYRLSVSPGQSLRFDVLASRLGSPLDPVLTLLNEQGGQLAANDDRPGMQDPGLDFTVPADLHALIVTVKDLRGGGGENAVYRLSVAMVGQPDFSLTLFEDRYQVPKDSSVPLRVRADRQGYDGPIQLIFKDLPEGIQVAGNEIPAGATDAIVTLTAGSSGPSHALTSITGRSGMENTQLERPALLEASDVSRRQLWLRGDVAIAVTNPAPLNVAWQEPDPNAQLVVGQPFSAKIQLTRSGGTDGPVRLTLLTSQVIPKKTVKVNNQDQQVDDLDRALRFEGELMVGAGQSDAAVTILVPGDLPLLPYDLVVRAELLGPDNKTVLATATTPARRLVAIKP